MLATIPEHVSRAPLHPLEEYAYRQLISRAMTQRLHDSLPHFSEFAHDWQVSRRRVKQKVEDLGITWDTFVGHVESAEREAHILTPTVYKMEQDIRQTRHDSYFEDQAEGLDDKKIRQSFEKQREPKPDTNEQSCACAEA
ncbi:hypothetical protein BS50DRAFT_586916 [Corynespora cassiicola Philippines]|uniref:Uncharacterized protein n=1 Tax=Corynespora cassiicola Philippines TaxID=1448308 RepID=A0A2T2NQD6_CORCC|nr:hypothetical protein BS50DRAFT_586916 [Corynespora cassiicola Philippines]